MQVLRTIVCLVLALVLAAAVEEDGPSNVVKLLMKSRADKAKAAAGKAAADKAATDKAAADKATGKAALGAQCDTHSNCNSGICISGACSPCVGDSCSGDSFCWNGKCLANREAILNDALACGTCNPGYKCKHVTDLGVDGLACVRDCPTVGLGGAECNEECAGNALSCENGYQFTPGNYNQSTYCVPGAIFVRNPYTSSALGGMINGFCGDPGVSFERCLGNTLPDASGNIMFECVRQESTTYATSSPLWIENGPSSGQKLCIRPLCQIAKRVKCVGNATSAQCWSSKNVRNYANECQWQGSCENGGTLEDRALNPDYCTATAALA